MGLRFRFREKKLKVCYCIEGVDLLLLSVYSASMGALGGVSFTCTPPRFLCVESAKGSVQPPSVSGVASQSRIKCLLGAGGG